jgi:polyketide synthase PksL
VNAHVAVEEYVSPNAAEGRGQGPAIVVLSARDAERLKEQAQQLLQAIVGRGLSDGDLAGVAYTLQVGREAMEHRLGMVVGSMQELAAKLTEFAQGKSQGLYLGEVKQNSETLAVFSGDEELREAVDKWIQRGKWSKLLELWVKGLALDWRKLYGETTPRRMSLPTYPFARERYWIDEPASRPVAPHAVLHPLLHRNTSDLSEQRYSSIFTGEEFFLADHQVAPNGHGAQKVLPAAAFLEMARAAVEQASPTQPEPGILELHNTVWLKPIVVAERKEVSIGLSLEENGHLDYEIYSEEAEQKTIHCQGFAVFSRRSTPARLDIDQIKGQMKQGRLEAPHVYAKFTEMGLHYGPAHQGIAAIYLGDKQILAQLRLPLALEINPNEYVLHPSLLDSALQASLGLIVDLNHVPRKPSLPFILESVRIVSACTREMMAWARYTEGSHPEDKIAQLDIDLCDQQGNVCVQMRGIASRVLESESNAICKSKIKPLVPVKAILTVDSFDFDKAFYQNLISDIVSHEVSVEEAVELG